MIATRPIIQEFRAVSFSPPDQRVTVCIRYDRNSSRKTAYRLCPRLDLLKTLDSQLEQLRAAGCGSRNIYCEKVTGARADRRALNRMLRKLAAGVW